MGTAVRFAFLLVITVLALINLSESSPQSKPGCPGACPAVFQPVCGKMGSRYKTFGNRCALDLENKCNGGRWTFVSNGACPNNG